MFAIQNIKTKKFVFGTDYRYFTKTGKHNQRTSREKMLTYDDYYDAAMDFRKRRCGRDYRIVILKKVKVKWVLEFDYEDRYLTYWEKAEKGG